MYNFRWHYTFRVLCFYWYSSLELFSCYFRTHLLASSTLSHATCLLRVEIPFSLYAMSPLMGILLPFDAWTLVCFMWHIMHWSCNSTVVWHKKCQNKLVLRWWGAQIAWLIWNNGNNCPHIASTSMFDVAYELPSIIEKLRSTSSMFVLLDMEIEWV